MARIKYYYDTETCKYERVRTRKSDIVLNALGFLSLTVMMAVALLILYDNYFDSPKELILKNEVKELEFYYDKLNKDVEQLSQILDEIEQRDDNIYRVVLGAEIGMVEVLGLFEHVLAKHAVVESCGGDRAHMMEDAGLDFLREAHDIACPVDVRGLLRVSG